MLRFNPERTGSAVPMLAPLLHTLETQGQLAGLTEKPELRQNPEAFEAELLAAIFDPDRPASLRRIAEQLQRLAILVRDRTSNDMWRVLSLLSFARAGVVCASTSRQAMQPSTWPFRAMR